jgi:hypothetical protein
VEAAEPYLAAHKLRRLESGEIQYSPGGGRRPQVGGADVIALAVREIFGACREAERLAPGNPASRQARSADAEIETEVRARHHVSPSELEEPRAMSDTVAPTCGERKS